MEYIKIIIILVLLGLIFIKHNTVEKMTESKNISEIVKDNINEMFNIEEVRKLSKVSKYLNNEGAVISKNLTVNGKLILPKNGLVYVRQNDGSIKTLDLNNLITHGTDVILKMQDEPVTLACTDNDKTCCNGSGNEKCFYHQKPESCLKESLNSDAKLPINISGNENYGMNRLHVFTLDKKIMEIPNNSNYDYEPNYDEPEVIVKTETINNKNFSGEIKRVDNLKLPE